MYNITCHELQSDNILVNPKDARVLLWGKIRKLSKQDHGDQSAACSSACRVIGVASFAHLMHIL